MTDADPGHDHYRDLTAAYVLGALDPGERSEIEAHLRTCDTCRQDVVAFAPLPALLGRLDGASVVSGEPTVPHPDAVVDSVRADISRLDRSRRRWRWGTGIAAAAVVVLGALVVSQDDGSQARRTSGTGMDVQTASASADATVVASEHAWGTYVRVSTDGLPDRASYALWVVDEAGDWERAGSWAPTPGGVADLGGSSRLRLTEIDRIVVTSVDRDDELLVAR